MLLGIEFNAEVSINTLLSSTIPVVGAFAIWRLNQVHKIVNSAATALREENERKQKLQDARIATLEDLVLHKQELVAEAQRGQVVAETKLEMIVTPPTVEGTYDNGTRVFNSRGSGTSADEYGD